MRQKITFLSAGLCLLAAVLLLAHAWHQEPETIYAPDDLIRLHVVANSDSAADQDLKRKVRDAIIRNVAPIFLSAGNIDSARAIARDNLDSIRQIASREIRAGGKEYPVRVELDSFPFPTKHYGPFVLPAGEYEAVQVVIGAGGGANWWCVLFPPLCFVDMSKDVAIAPPENNSPNPGTPPQNPGAAKEPPQVSPAPPPPFAQDRGVDMENTGENLAKVEFRFKILDFLQQFIN